MRVDFRHMNPRSGNESVLLRFEEQGSYGSGYTPCLLVDSGSGVDITSVLEDDEYLVGILLTHAHSDHYQTLSDSLQDGAKVYAPPGTASILDGVLTEGGNHEDLGDTESVIDRLVSVDGWESVLDTVRIHPIPAGHAPGASGFAIQFKDKGEWNTILATGDFTFTRSAGYPSFSPPATLTPGCVFLTGATGDSDGEHSEITSALHNAAEQAMAGSTVFLAASGLSCVEYGYLLGHISERYELNVPITLAGHAAKLYNSLDYDVPNVTTAPKFSHPDEVLEPGRITIAGPQNPTEKSSGRLYGYIKSNPNATFVQITDGSEQFVDGGSCTHFSTSHIPHPSEDEIDRLVSEMNPTEVVITHQSPRRSSRFKDKYSSYVWATDDEYWHTLWENGWKAPPWVTDEGKRYVTSNQQNSLTYSGSGEPPMPDINRETDFDMEEEGLVSDQLNRLGRPSPRKIAGSVQKSQTDTVDSEKSSTETQTLPKLDSEHTLASMDRSVIKTESQDEDTTEIPARVIDAGDGVTLLKIKGDTNGFEHGDDVEIRVV